MEYALVLILGLVAGTVGGIVGFGSSIMLMPGAFIAKRYVRQLDAGKFRFLMDALMLVAGLVMLGAAINRPAIAP